jgi:hypothetical protein
MSTPGRRRALRALAHARRTNANRAARGLPVTIGGKTISAKTYKRKFGLPQRLQEQQ